MIRLSRALKHAERLDPGNRHRQKRRRRKCRIRAAELRRLGQEGISLLLRHTMQEAVLRRTDEDMLPGLRPVVPVKQPADGAGGDAAFHIDSALRDQKQAEVLPLEPAAQLLVGACGQACARKNQPDTPLFSKCADRRLRRKRRVAAADDHECIAELRDLLCGLADREHCAGHHALRRVQPAKKVRAVRHVGPELHMRVKQILLPGQQIRQADAPPNIR